MEASVTLFGEDDRALVLLWSADDDHPGLGLTVRCSGREVFQLEGVRRQDALKLFRHLGALLELYPPPEEGHCPDCGAELPGPEEEEEDEGEAEGEGWKKG